jgi:hypothetical protein
LAGLASIAKSVEFGFAKADHFIVCSNFRASPDRGAGASVETGTISGSHVISMHCRKRRDPPGDAQGYRMWMDRAAR